MGCSGDDVNGCDGRAGNMVVEVVIGFSVSNIAMLVIAQGWIWGWSRGMTYMVEEVQGQWRNMQ